MTRWRIEADGWSRLSEGAKGHFLFVAGNFGGEWWGRGTVEFSDRESAFLCVDQARACGHACHLVLRIVGAT
jgi:hypothetical protein